MGAIPPVSEPAISASGLSRQSRLYDASANSRVEHAAVCPTLHQWVLTPHTAPVEWPHANASFGWARRPEVAERHEMAPYTHTTLAVHDNYSSDRVWRLRRSGGHNYRPTRRSCAVSKVRRHHTRLRSLSEVDAALRLSS